MEFINSIYGFWTLAYFMVGCIIMKKVDRGDRDIGIIAWIVGATFWFPAVLHGFIDSVLGRNPE